MSTGRAPDFMVAVFCGARPGARAEYGEAAGALGSALAARQIGIVCGGSRTGLMGALADGCLDAGGHVEGVLPGFLIAHELAHPRLSARVQVDTMHARKAHMLERAQAIVVLPGGLGTCDELFEAATWADLGMHGKPIWLLNTVDYFLPLLSCLQHFVREGFAARDALGLFETCGSVAALVQELSAFQHAAHDVRAQLLVRRREGLSDAVSAALEKRVDP